MAQAKTVVAMEHAGEWKRITLRCRRARGSGRKNQFYPYVTYVYIIYTLLYVLVCVYMCVFLYVYVYNIICMCVYGDSSIRYGFVYIEPPDAHGLMDHQTEFDRHPGPSACRCRHRPGDIPSLLLIYDSLTTCYYYYYYMFTGSIK